MIRKASIEEIQARFKSGDRSFLSWLRSAARRDALATEKNRAGNRFLAGYWRKALHDATGVNLILNIGCGIGVHAYNLVQQPTARFVGMDYDPECVKLCRKQFGGLPGFQFHNIDYMNPPKLPRKFDYIVITHILNSLPLYKDLLSQVWHRCSKGMVVLFDETLIRRDSDYVGIDIQEGRLHTTYSLPKFQTFCESMAPLCEAVTVFSDNSQEKEHAFLLRHDETVPNLSGVHHFAENGVTFPFYSEGVL